MHIYLGIVFNLILLFLRVNIDPLSIAIAIEVHVNVLLFLLIFLTSRRLFQNILHLLLIGVNQSTLSVFNVTFPVDIELIIALQVFSEALHEAVGCVAAIWDEYVLTSLRVYPVEVEPFSDVLQLFFVVFFLGLLSEPVASIKIVVVVAIGDGYSSPGAILAEPINFAAFKFACIFSHRFITLWLAFDWEFLVHIDDEGLPFEEFIIDVEDSDPE